MTDSILNSVKKMMGIDETDTAFDTDLIININTTLTILYQLGAGPSSPFKITGTTETWSDFIGTKTDIDTVKTYTYMKARKMFDPPTSSAVSTALDQMIDELEFRINIAVDDHEVTEDE